MISMTLSHLSYDASCRRIGPSIAVEDHQFDSSCTEFTPFSPMWIMDKLTSNHRFRSHLYIHYYLLQNDCRIILLSSFQLSITIKVSDKNIIQNYNRLSDNTPMTYFYGVVQYSPFKKCFDNVEVD